MSEKIEKAIENIQAVMTEEGIDPRQGLPKELFLFATTLMPCPNTDLFITRRSSLLFAWRDDEFYGQGWHIPGGCIRLGETLDKMIQETARREIGTEIVCDRECFITREAMVTEDRPCLQNQLERCHNISMLFRCSLPDEFEIRNQVEANEPGFIQWYDHRPEDLLPLHEKLYGDIIEKFFKGELK